jgi:hypothetical protein
MAPLFWPSRLEALPVSHLIRYSRVSYLTGTLSTSTKAVFSMHQATSLFDKSQQPSGNKWDSTAGGVDECGNPTVVGGVFHFWGLIDGGFLT